MAQLSEVDGLKVLYVNEDFAPSCSVQFWFRAGSALEDKEHHGVAHFLEHMFFKGSKKYPGSKIAYEVESFGGEINAFTSFDYTCYYINAPADHLKKTLNILLDMVSNPLFLTKDLNPEKQVVLEEFNRSQDDPNQYFFQQIQKACFTGPYAHPILGEKKSILDFDKKKITHFRKKFYNKANALLLIAGPVHGGTADKKQLDRIIAGYQFPKGTPNDFPQFNLKKKNKRINVHHKPVRQAELAFSIPAQSSRDQKASAEDLTLHCLSFGETSPFFQELIHKTSLASNIGSSTLFFQKGGTHFIKLSYPIENHDEILKKLLELLNDIKEKGFSAQELDRIKNQYLASKIYEKESIESYASSLGHSYALTGDIHSDQEYIDKIKSCSQDLVAKSFEEIFSRDFHYHLQLPMDTEEKPFLDSIEAFDQKRANSFTWTKDHANFKVLQKSRSDRSVELIELKKGINLIFKNNLKTPTYAMNAYLKGGLSKENLKNNGSYYLLSKLLTYGHQSKDYIDFKNELSLKATYLSSICGKNAYGLQLHGLSEYFPSIAFDLVESLKSPSLKSDFFKLEKELVKRALDNFKEDPGKNCFLHFNREFFGDHPYSLPILGSELSLERINAEQLLAIQKENLDHSPILFSYCGNGEKNQIVDYFLEFTSDLPERDYTKSNHFQFNLEKDKHTHIPFDREQTHIYMGIPGHGIQDKEDIYLKILTSYLSGQSSELFVTVRDKLGLCYVVQPVHHNALEGGHWGVYIVTGNDKVNQALEAINRILNSLADKGLSKREFDRIKKMIEGQRSLALQTNEDYINLYAIPALHGLGLDFEYKRSQALSKMSVDSFNRFLKKFLKQNKLTITVGQEVSF
jgi:zinc protease